MINGDFLHIMVQNGEGKSVLQSLAGYDIIKYKP